MATERAALDDESQRIQAENFWLSLDQNASNAILRRTHQNRLPLEYDARNLFNMLGAGLSNPPELTQAVEVPVTGATTQPCVADPPRLNLTPPQQVSTPPGHYSNPLDNMIVVASGARQVSCDG